MQRLLVAFAFMALFVATPAAAEPDAAAALKERALGAADAPVTMNEYASLTCSHCAAFHRDTLPQLKTDYIETGKVRLVFHDFPLDQLAFAGAVVARCAPPQQYWGFLEVLFRQQTQWAQSNDPRGALMKFAKMGGLSEADFEACLKLDDLVKGIQARAAEAQARHDIRSTPTFIINGKKIAGAAPYETFKAAIDEALAAKQ